MWRCGGEWVKGSARNLYLVKKIIKKTYLYLYYVSFTITSLLDFRYINISLGLGQEKNEKKLIKLIIIICEWF